MPGSKRENNFDLREFVNDNPIRTVLDVGPGRGTYAHVLSNMGLVMDAVEIWRPYIRRYDLTRLYRRVVNEDIRAYNTDDFSLYDMVIFGDVLEHMSRWDAMACWDKARQGAGFVMMSVPIIHYPQRASHGNPYELHVQEHLTPDVIRDDYGPFIFDRCYEVTGTFIAKGHVKDGGVSAEVSRNSTCRHDGGTADCPALCLYVHGERFRAEKQSG